MVGGGFQIDRFRKRRHQGGINGIVFRIASAAGAEYENRLAFLEPRDIGTDSFDMAGHLIAEDGRQGRLPLVDAGPQQDIGITDPKGMSAHKHLVRGRLRFWDIHDFDDFGAAVTLNLNCLHELSPQLR